jgi:AcrR family transcriptional regulator
MDAGPPTARPTPAAREATSRHHRRARRDRGADTRARLIEAALDVFGRLGFEGAGTRQIAKEADANLAAIVYHFGSKEALHIAVAEHIVARVRERIGASIAAAATAEATATPEGARLALANLIANFVDVLLGDADAERWARFIIREQLQPTAAFDVIFGFMGPAHGIGTRLVATILGRPEDEEARIRTFTIIGQVMVFRVAQTLALRRLGWSEIGAAERARIKRIVTAQTMALLDAEREA